MNRLVEIRNNQVVVDSKSVAENFGKSHRHVNRDIEHLIQKDVSKIGHMFYETETPDSYGRMQKSYYMNRDGFSLLVMGFTGKEAIEWKLKYIEAFNAMESHSRIRWLCRTSQIRQKLPEHGLMSSKRESRPKR